jgi:iron complex outermembrane receptor protein
MAQAQAPVLEEVLVTAQKRTESLQDVPVSVSAINGDQIREGLVSGMGDVALRTPNFSMTQFNIGEPQYFIRGVGSTLDSAASDSAVATFIDEVYIGRPGGGSTDLYDLERIEVLRGPQGTLFGKNVVGGAVSMYTRRPSQDFEASVSGTAGDYDLGVVQGMVNGPLTDTVAAKLVGQYKQRDGYVKNVENGNDYQDEDNKSVRGQLQYDPQDDLSILLGADWSKDDVNGNCRNVNNLDLHDPLGLAGFYPPVIDATTGGDIRKCASSTDAFQKREVSGGLLRVDWGVADATLTSITAYREMDYHHEEDLAAMPLGTTPFNLVDSVKEDSDQFSQEFRLASDGAEKLSWLVGAFYMEENVDRKEGFIGSFGPPLVPGSAVLLDGNIDFTQKAETTSYAFFGQIDYDFNEQWSASIGSRYTYDKKDITQGLVNNEDPAFDTAVLSGALGAPPSVIEAIFAPEEAVVLGIPANGPANLGAFAATGDTSLLAFPYKTDTDDDWDKVTSSASLNWNYSDDGMLYLSFAQGYKSGAFVSSVTNPEAAAVPLEPETADSWELGLKSEFFDNRLRVNASVFTMDYKDLQVFRLVGSLLVGANAKATSEGVELDITGLVTENWTLSANYAYLDATYDNYEDGVIDFSGNTLPRAPEDSFFAQSSYRTPLPGGSEIEWIVSYAYSGSFYFDPNNSQASKEDSYGVIDASATWSSPQEQWNITIWGKNLDDEEYRIHSITSNIAGTVDIWGPPRTYGGTVKYTF